MRRAGAAEPTTNSNARRSRLILIAAGAVLAIAVVASMVLLGWSGIWVGLLGLAAGAGVGIAIGTGKTWVVERGRLIAIAIGAVGIIAAVVGATGLLDMSLWIAAPVGCGVGALFAEVSYQQTVPPQSPPPAALALLRRSGAQPMEAPGLGNCVWATPDRKIRVIIGATLGPKTTTDNVIADRRVRKSRQRGNVIQKRISPLDPQPGVICVVDAAIPTTRDGDDTICSAGALTKVIGR